MVSNINYTIIFHLTTILVCISSLISFSEWYFLLKNEKLKHLFSWDVYGTQNKYYQNKIFLKYINPLLLGRIEYLLFSGISLSSTIIIGSFFSSYFYFLLPLLLILLLLKQIHTPFGLEGSDQMQLIIVGSLTISLMNIEKGAIIAFSFISIQLIFSYFFSGISKLRSPLWRCGQALRLTLKTNSYGNKTIYELLNKKTRISLIACWFIMCWEILFIACPFLPNPLFYSMLIIAFMFHLSNAFIMKLNGFFLTWIAAFPSIIYIHMLLIK